MYSSYTAAQIARTYELADLHKVNLVGSVTWAFEFEGQPYFAGFRDLATNGLAKPVLNVFRMLGKMSGDRVRVRSDSAAPVEEIRDRGVRGRRDVYALAARGAGDFTALVWNYHDDDLPAPPASVELTIEGLKNGAASVTHYRVDGEHGNSYSAWLKMGSPQPPTPAQYQELERAARLAPLGTPRRVTIQAGALTEKFSLPAQGVSLLVITPQ
jgi:xylan 1,4-beta-xylosidase